MSQTELVTSLPSPQLGVVSSSTASVEEQSVSSAPPRRARRRARGRDDDSVSSGSSVLSSERVDDVYRRYNEWRLDKELHLLRKNGRWLVSDTALTFSLKNPSSSDLEYPPFVITNYIMGDLNDAPISSVSLLLLGSKERDGSVRYNPFSFFNSKGGITRLWSSKLELLRVLMTTLSRMPTYLDADRVLVNADRLIHQFVAFAERAVGELHDAERITTLDSHQQEEVAERFCVRANDWLVEVGVFIQSAVRLYAKTSEGDERLVGTVVQASLGCIERTLRWCLSTSDPLAQQFLMQQSEALTAVVAAFFGQVATTRQIPAADNQRELPSRITTYTPKTIFFVASTPELCDYLSNLTDWTVHFGGFRVVQTEYVKQSVDEDSRVSLVVNSLAQVPSGSIALASKRLLSKLGSDKPFLVATVGTKKVCVGVNLFARLDWTRVELERVIVELCDQGVIPPSADVRLSRNYIPNRASLRVSKLDLLVDGRKLDGSDLLELWLSVAASTRTAGAANVSATPHSRMVPVAVPVGVKAPQVQAQAVEKDVELTQSGSTSQAATPLVSPLPAASESGEPSRAKPLDVKSVSRGTFLQSLASTSRSSHDPTPTAIAKIFQDDPSDSELVKQAKLAVRGILPKDARMSFVANARSFVDAAYNHSGNKAPIDTAPFELSVVTYLGPSGNPRFPYKFQVLGVEASQSYKREIRQSGNRPVNATGLQLYELVTAGREKIAHLSDEGASGKVRARSVMSVPELATLANGMCNQHVAETVGPITACCFSTTATAFKMGDLHDQVLEVKIDTFTRPDAEIQKALSQASRVPIAPLKEGQWRLALRLVQDSIFLRHRGFNLRVGGSSNVHLEIEIISGDRGRCVRSSVLARHVQSGRSDDGGWWVFDLCKDEGLVDMATHRFEVRISDRWTICNSLFPPVDHVCELIRFGTVIDDVADVSAIAPAALDAVQGCEYFKRRCIMFAHIIRGPPGTGKTTFVRGLFRSLMLTRPGTLHRDRVLRVLYVTETNALVDDVRTTLERDGVADVVCSTVDSYILKVECGTMLSQWDVVVVDEAAKLDIYKSFRLIQCVRHAGVFLALGDEFQVGPSVFFDKAVRVGMFDLLRAAGAGLSQLDTTFRMNAASGALLRTMYAGMHAATPAPLNRQQPSQVKYVDVITPESVIAALPAGVSPATSLVDDDTKAVLMTFKVDDAKAISERGIFCTTIAKNQGTTVGHSVLVVLSDWTSYPMEYINVALSRGRLSNSVIFVGSANDAPRVRDALQSFFPHPFHKDLPVKKPVSPDFGVWQRLVETTRSRCKSTESIDGDPESWRENWPHDSTDATSSVVTVAPSSNAAGVGLGLAGLPEANVRAADSPPPLLPLPTPSPVPALTSPQPVPIAERLLTAGSSVGPIGAAGRASDDEPVILSRKFPASSIRQRRRLLPPTRPLVESEPVHSRNGDDSGLSTSNLTDYQQSGTDDELVSLRTPRAVPQWDMLHPMPLHPAPLLVPPPMTPERVTNVDLSRRRTEPRLRGRDGPSSSDSSSESSSSPPRGGPGRPPAPARRERVQLPVLLTAEGLYSAEVNPLLHTGVWTGEISTDPMAPLYTTNNQHLVSRTSSDGAIAMVADLHAVAARLGNIAIDRSSFVAPVLMASQVPPEIVARRTAHALLRVLSSQGYLLRLRYAGRVYAISAQATCDFELTPGEHNFVSGATMDGSGAVLRVVDSLLVEPGWRPAALLLYPAVKTVLVHDSGSPGGFAVPLVPRSSIIPLFAAPADPILQVHRCTHALACALENRHLTRDAVLLRYPDLAKVAIEALLECRVPTQQSAAGDVSLTCNYSHARVDIEPFAVIESSPSDGRYLYTHVGSADAFRLTATGVEFANFCAVVVSALRCLRAQGRMLRNVMRSDTAVFPDAWWVAIGCSMVPEIATADVVQHPTGLPATIFSYNQVDADYFTSLPQVKQFFDQMAYKLLLLRDVGATGSWSGFGGFVNYTAEDSVVKMVNPVLSVEQRFSRYSYFNHHLDNGAVKSTPLPANLVGFGTCTRPIRFFGDPFLVSFTMSESVRRDIIPSSFISVPSTVWNSHNVANTYVRYFGSLALSDLELRKHRTGTVSRGIMDRSSEMIVVACSASILQRAMTGLEAGSTERTDVVSIRELRRDTHLASHSAAHYTVHGSFYDVSDTPLVVNDRLQQTMQEWDLNPFERVLVPLLVAPRAISPLEVTVAATVKHTMSPLFNFVRSSWTRFVLTMLRFFFVVACLGVAGYAAKIVYDKSSTVYGQTRSVLMFVAHMMGWAGAVWCDQAGRSQRAGHSPLLRLLVYAIACVSAIQQKGFDLAVLTNWSFVLVSTSLRLKHSPHRFWAKSLLSLHVVQAFTVELDTMLVSYFILAAHLIFLVVVLTMPSPYLRIYGSHYFTSADRHSHATSGNTVASFLFASDRVWGGQPLRGRYVHGGYMTVAFDSRNKPHLVNVLTPSKLREAVSETREFDYGVAGTSHLLALEARRLGRPAGIWVGDIVFRDGQETWVRLPVKERILALAGLSFYTPDDLRSPTPSIPRTEMRAVSCPDSLSVHCVDEFDPHPITLLPYPVARMIALLDTLDEPATPMPMIFLPWNQPGYDYARETLFRTGVRPDHDEWPLSTLQGHDLELNLVRVDGDSGRLPYLFACCGFDEVVNASFIPGDTEAGFLLARSSAKARCACPQWVPSDGGVVAFLIDGFFVSLDLLPGSIANSTGMDIGCTFPVKNDQHNQTLDDTLSLWRSHSHSSEDVELSVTDRHLMDTSSCRGDCESKHQRTHASGSLASEKDRLYARLGRMKIVPKYQLLRTSPCTVTLKASGSIVDGVTGVGPTESAAKEHAAAQANDLLDKHETNSLASGFRHLNVGSTSAVGAVDPDAKHVSVAAESRPLVGIVERRVAKLARAVANFDPRALPATSEALSRFGFCWEYGTEFSIVATTKASALISHRQLQSHGRVSEDVFTLLERAYDTLDVSVLFDHPADLAVLLENLTVRVRMCDVDPTSLRGGDVALPLRLEDRDLHFARVRDMYSTFDAVKLPFRGVRLPRGRHIVTIEAESNVRQSACRRILRLLALIFSFGLCSLFWKPVNTTVRIDCERGWCFPLTEDEAAELFDNERVTRLKSSTRHVQECMIEDCRGGCCSTDIRSIQAGPIAVGDGFAFLPYANADCPSNNLRAAYNVVVNMDRTPPLLETALPALLVSEFSRYKDHVGSNCDEHVSTIREALSQAPLYTRRKCERVLTQEPQMVDVRFPYRDDIAPVLPELQTVRNAGPIFRFGAFIKMENANVVCEVSDSVHAKESIGGQRYYPKKPKVRSIQALGIVQAVLMPLWDFLARVVYFIFTRRDAPVYSAVGALAGEISEWFTTAVARGFKYTVPLDGVGMDVRNKWPGRWASLKQLWSLFFAQPMPSWLSTAWTARLSGYWVEYAKCSLRIMINSLCSGEGDTTLANVIAQMKAVYAFLSDDTLNARFRAQFGYDLPVPTFGELGYDGVLAPFPAVLVVTICGDDLLALIYESFAPAEQEWVRAELIASYRRFGFEFDGPETQTYEHSSFLSAYFLPTVDDHSVFEFVPHVGRALSKMFTLSDLPREYFEEVPVDYAYSRLHAKLTSMWQAFAHVPILRDAVAKWAEQAADIARRTGVLYYVPDDARARIFVGPRRPDVDLESFALLYPSVFASGAHVVANFHQLLEVNVWSDTMPTFVAEMALADRDR